MNYEILEALGQIAREKNVNRDLVVETLKAGLLTAAKKRFGTAENIEIKVDQNTGDTRIFATKRVAEEVKNPSLEAPLEEARRIDPNSELGSEITEELSFADFGRNAIQTVKQILVQKVREAEREKIYEDYRGRIGEIVSGSVQQISRGDIIVNIGRTEAIVPFKEQIKREKYKQGDTIRAYIVDVLKTTKGPQIILSKTHPGFLERLFQLEVPEIYEGIVEIKAVAREAGERSKVAVASSDEQIDAVGACVGMKGSRVQAIVRELNNERIDIIAWSSDPVTFLARALSPATVSRVICEDEEKGRMIAIVDEEQRSLAIGKSGQNARLAARLTGLKIDILTELEYQERLGERKRAEIDLTDLPGVGERVAEKLRSCNIESVEDLAKLSVEKLLEIPGIGQARAEEILKAVRKLVSKEEEE